MTHKNRARIKANENRRKKIEAYRKSMNDLPIAEQHKRWDERKAAHQALYPEPPKYDQFAHVRGNPDLRGQVPVNQPKHVVPVWGLPELLGVFGVGGILNRRNRGGR